MQTSSSLTDREVRQAIVEWIAKHYGIKVTPNQLDPQEGTFYFPHKLPLSRKKRAK